MLENASHNLPAHLQILLDLKVQIMPEKSINKTQLCIYQAAKDNCLWKFILKLNIIIMRGLLEFWTSA